MEASRPRNEGDTARLVSRKLATMHTLEFTFTLYFWYHMYGRDIGTLNVYYNKNHNHGGLGDLVWTKTGTSSWTSTLCFPYVLTGIEL